MATLSGSSISQIGRFSAGDGPAASDVFVASQFAVPGVPACGYQSKSIEYGMVADGLYKDVSASFGFGSMAYQESADYAPAVHTHAYNAFDVSAVYDYRRDDVTTLATFRIGNRYIRLCVPRITAYLEPEPVVGQLKFKALPSATAMSDVNINSPSFDGWVYPAGQSYSVAANDFRDAKAAFGQRLDATTLVVPELSGFLKANPAGGQVVTSVGFNNPYVPPHRHETTISMKGGSQTVTVKVDASKSAGDGGYLHNGKKPNGVFKSKLALELTDFGLDGEAQIGDSARSLDREQYPAFNYLPTMIYIGRKS